MAGRNKKSPREKDITSRYLAGGMDEDRMEAGQRFSSKNKNMQANKTAKTAAARELDSASGTDIDGLPWGEVIQVHSLYLEVVSDGVVHLCVARKTMSRVRGSQIVVGDRVRFRPTGGMDEQGRPEGVIERIEPRETVLTRADSFKQVETHPIVANAKRMLIVVSLLEPRPKWGLVDRMLVAAMAGGLEPVLCLNKVDLAAEDDDAKIEADAVLAHYATMGIRTLRTSVERGDGMDELGALLKDTSTVLAGHSGVGKSSLIRAVEPTIDLRVAAISNFNQKGRHTTTSARRYVLRFGGTVIDTPGVKLFGLWNVTRESLKEQFPDIEDDTAPEWRKVSFERIAESLK